MDNTELYTDILKATGRVGDVEIKILNRFLNSEAYKGITSATLGEAMQFLIDNGLVYVRKDGNYWKRYLHITREAETVINTDNGMQIFIDGVHKKEKEAKELKAENEKLDLAIKRQTVSGTNFSRNVTYYSLFIASLSIIVPVIIWVMDKDDEKQSQLEPLLIQKELQMHQQVQKNSQDIQKILLTQDTLRKVLKTQKNEPYKNK